MSTPSERYYREMADRWRGALTLTIVDTVALAKLSFFDRLSWRMTALLGRTWLETSVDASRIAERIVVHTTRVRHFGIPLVFGLETITLDPDGRRFTLRGSHRFLHTFWRTHDVIASGEVQDDAQGAAYAFTYLGAEMTQTTRIDGRDLVVTQTTPFSRSEVRLQRRG